MKRAELRDLNRRLAKFGQRYCPGCGATLALTDEHWYFSRKGRDRTILRPSSLCKKCTCLTQSEAERKRYKRDKGFRETKRQYREAYFAVPENLQHHRKHKREYMERKRSEAKRQHYKLVIKAVQS